MLISLAVRRIKPLVLVLGLLAPSWGIMAEAPGPATQAPALPVPPAPAPPAPDSRSLMQLGPGDSVAVQVYGQPDMGATVYVSDDGTIPMPLVGAVQVAGMSPAAAARQIEGALRTGKFLVDPHVTITVTQSRSQRVSVLGEVGTPGRYTIESNETIFDLLAQAGGTKETSADVAYLMRPDKNGNMERFEVNLKSFTREQKALPTQLLQGGDSVYVPRAEQFYIFGEVTAPNMYRIEPGMTVIQAIARAGGITARGSKSRLEIKRKGADGREVTIKAKGSDPVQANDVIRVKESIF